jgi:hypothetical protein
VVEGGHGHVPGRAPSLRPRLGPVAAAGGAVRLGRTRHFHGWALDDGFIVLGGPLADEVRVAHVVEAESEAAIRSRLARDPWSETHLQLGSIDPWTIRLDGRRN